MNGWIHVARAAIAALSAAACVAGCADGSETPSETPKPPTTSSTSASAVPTGTPAPSGPTGVSNGQTYSATTALVEGQTPDGKGKWQVRIAQISGGDAAVADAFNKASRASADYLVKSFDPYGPPDSPWKFEATEKLSFGIAFIAQLLTGSIYVERSAHPVGYIATVVIDSRTARPITLGDLFTDDQAGLDKLSAQTRVLYPKLTNGVEADEKGSAAKAENFDNWIPTVDGIVIHYDDYQLGPHGLVELTVPWSELTGLLAPDMVALSQG